MQDGANDDWLFEGEATPIGGNLERDSDELAFAGNKLSNSGSSGGESAICRIVNTWLSLRFVVMD
jgi:hypothetical protein